MPIRVAICIGCGCDDTHACISDADVPCSWLVVDRGEQRGVCTECPSHLRRYKAGDRQLSVRAANLVKRRAGDAVASR